MSPFSLFACTGATGNFNLRGVPVTSIGDIEIELVFRIAVRGRMRDLAELMRTLENTGALILLPVNKISPVEEDGNSQILVTIGRVES
jgi:hypothetical protein